MARTFTVWATPPTVSVTGRVGRAPMEPATEEGRPRPPAISTERSAPEALRDGIAEDGQARSDTDELDRSRPRGPTIVAFSRSTGAAT